MRGYHFGVATGGKGVGVGGGDGKPLGTGSLTARPHALYSTGVLHAPSHPEPSLGLLSPEERAPPPWLRIPAPQCE